MATTVFGLATPVGFSEHKALLQINSADAKLELDAWIQYIEDAKGTLSLADVIAKKRNWKQNEAGTFNKSYNESVWWLRINTLNANRKTLRRLLEISYAVIDHVDVHIVRDGKVLESYFMGDKKNFVERPMDHRFFIVPIQWEPQDQLDIYIRLKTSSSVQAPLTLWEEKIFYGYDTTRTIVHGIFFGIMIVIAAYNLLIYMVLGERSYILYVGYVMCMPLFLASIGGYSFRYLWPTFTTWNDQAILVFLSGVVAFGARFTQRFLCLNEVAKPLNRLVELFFWGSLVLAVSAFWLPYHYNIIVLIPWAAAACIGALSAGIYCWYKKQHTAKYYTIAWGAMLLGGVILAMNKTGILPTNMFTEYATHIGSALEVVLLSFALAERINTERRLRYEAQVKLLESTQRVNEELEVRVQERTEKLEQLTRQLMELSNTDQLTGLHNRRYLDEALLEEFQRSTRYHHCLAIVLIDIDHFKQVNDEYGHQAGDDCLREVAQRIKQGLRWPSDIPARYGGEEFCLLLSETEEQGAYHVAERVRILIEEKPVRTCAGVISVTMSAGVYAQIPNPESSIAHFLQQADTALYQAKRNGRNQVIIGKAEGDPAEIVIKPPVKG
ncbi:7TM domain sensor-containing signal transduction diguanylate cyclase [Oleiphilus messinensis]|uniref:diguanylate cyclase n=2 Tax=Oleiphilus messinensis TaxID=141451 RepID=A0A1Y0IA94_9GAMM|nr:7TM domain sensor-containing signal transduction diguanylate cyclase [Oleiphilus messinensis]